MDESDESGTVIDFPVKPRSSDDERAAVDVGARNRFRVDGCRHDGQVLVDEALDAVECGKCGEMLNPLWVLKSMAHREHRLVTRLKDLREQVSRLEGKRRTKCENCGQMTRISPKRR